MFTTNDGLSSTMLKEKTHELPTGPWLQVRELLHSHYQRVIGTIHSPEAAVLYGHLTGKCLAVFTVEVDQLRWGSQMRFASGKRVHNDVKSVF